MSGTRRRRLRLALILLLSLVTLVAWAPLALALGGIATASLLGCGLNEAQASPCLLAGQDIGGTLYVLGMMMWIAIFAMPLMAVTLGGWLVVWVTRARRASSPVSSAEPSSG